MPDAAPDRPRSPAAIRQARYRRRARWLLSAITLDVDQAAVTSWLIDGGYLEESEAGNDDQFRIALETAIARAAGARFPLRRYDSAEGDEQ